MSKLTLLLFLVLPACGSQQQMAERHAAILQTRAAVMSQVDGHCTSTGLVPGSQAYVDCLRITAKSRGYTLVDSGDRKEFTLMAENALPAGNDAARYVGSH